MASPESKRASDRPSQAGALFLAGALTLSGLLGLGALAIAPAEAAGTLAAVYPPGTPRAEIWRAVQESGARVVREGGLGSVILVNSPTPGLAAALERSGALIVLRADRARGCLGWNDRG